MYLVCVCVCTHLCVYVCVCAYAQRERYSQLQCINHISLTFMVQYTCSDFFHPLSIPGAERHRAVWRQFDSNHPNADWFTDQEQQGFWRESLAGFMISAKSGVVTPGLSTHHSQLTYTGKILCNETIHWQACFCAACFCVASPSPVSLLIMKPGNEWKKV